MAEEPLSCGGRGAGTKIPKVPEHQETEEEERKGDTMVQTVRIGKEAPEFEAPAYKDGGFTSVKLSDYRGKWLVLCFYPGDYTFV